MEHVNREFSLVSLGILWAQGSFGEFPTMKLGRVTLNLTWKVNLCSCENVTHQKLYSKTIINRECSAN